MEDQRQNLLNAIKTEDISKIIPELNRFMSLLDGLSLLHLAALKADSAAVDVILKYVVDVNNCQTRTRETPLHHALFDRNKIKERSQVVKSLLKAGANVNVEEKYYKKTPLQEAIITGNEEAVTLLLDAGADLEDTEAPTALAVAKSYGNKEIIKILEERGAKNDTMFDRK